MSKGPFHIEFPFSLCPAFCWKYFFPESQRNTFFLANVLGFHLFSKQEHQLSVFLEIILEVTQTLKKGGGGDTYEVITEENHTSFNLAFLLNTLCSVDTLLSDFEGD